jgi:BirA family biotin operon repressor/biotin-[acetyl-CoA-carboxylase] ligase
MKPLHADTIADACQSLANHAPEVVLFESIGSTNSWLVDHGSAHADFTLCCAEQQTAGRGRRGKTWLTPRGAITFSIQLRVPQPVSQLSGLSLLTGAAVCRVLRRQNLQDVMVKWPNDIYQRGHKLAGILIEVGASDEQGTVVVAGIGINYRQGAERRDIDQPNTDLHTACGGAPPDRSMLIGQIAAEWYKSATRFSPQAMQTLASDWAQFDFLHDRAVSILEAGDASKGIARGIDATGRLQVETAGGLLALSSGDVSIRADR